MFLALSALFWPVFAAPQEALPVVELLHDNTEIRESCRVHISPGRVIADGDGNGVLHILSPNVVVEFAEGSVLRGVRPDVVTEDLEGIGIRIEGVEGVVLKNAAVRGFRCGILATQADGLRVEGARLRNNFRQKLKSTPMREDLADWLRPHENDEQQWRKLYGAGLCIEDSTQVWVEGVEVRDQQNGIVLDRVQDATIQNNDCSYLSGWGLALWRSSNNLIQNNRFEFCVRGYSHQVYNRGQDSAGILLFEQCSENRILANTITHCGDGIFAFSGREALGEISPPEENFSYQRRGNAKNLIARNIIEDCVAHGIELTFGFDNQIIGNQISRNAICGIWGGYSQDTLIQANRFAQNGDAGYGLERGAINVDHPVANIILNNQFSGDRCGIHLWNQEHPFAQTPWAAANGAPSEGNLVLANHFQQIEPAIQLRGKVVALHRLNQLVQSTVEVEQDAQWKEYPLEWTASMPNIKVVEKAAPNSLPGREHILLTEWGPWNQKEKIWQLVSLTGREHLYRVLPGDAQVDLRFIEGGGKVIIRPLPQHPGPGKFYHVIPGLKGYQEYIISAVVDGRRYTFKNHFLGCTWQVRHFVSPCDPREDLETWRSAAEKEDAVKWSTTMLQLDFGAGGPKDVMEGDSRADFSTVDSFGTIATARIQLPKGRWVFRTRSDDGIRLWVDGKLLIDRWTHHAAVEDQAQLDLGKTKVVTVRVEHFELDGQALLSVDIEPQR